MKLVVGTGATVPLIVCVSGVFVSVPDESWVRAGVRKWKRSQRLPGEPPLQFPRPALGKTNPQSTAMQGGKVEELWKIIHFLRMWVKKRREKLGVAGD